MSELVNGLTCPKSEVVGNNGECIETDLNSIGKCPRCSGMVFELGDRFACQNTLDENSTCDFSYPKCFTEEAISPDLTGIDFGKLLLGPTRFISVEYNEEMEFELKYHGGEAGWGLSSKFV